MGGGLFRVFGKSNYYSISLYARRQLVPVNYRQFNRFFPLLLRWWMRERMIIINSFLLYIFVVNSCKKFASKGSWILVLHVGLFYWKKYCVLLGIRSCWSILFSYIYIWSYSYREKQLGNYRKSLQKKKLLDQTVAVHTQPVQIFPISMYTTWRWLTNSFSGALPLSHVPSFPTFFAAGNNLQRYTIFCCF